MYTVKIFKEEDIPWETQNQIHRLLNMAFKGKSVKFISKTYANIKPLARVLCFRNDELVAHTGINEDIMHIGDTTMKVGCLGLTAAVNHNKGLAIQALNAGATYLKSNGFELALGISNSPVMLKYIIPECNGVEFPISVRGNNSISKPSDHAIFFSLTIDAEKLKKLIEKAIVSKEIILEGEVF